jgi:flagellar protein FliS
MVPASLATHRYRTTQVKTCSPGELLVLLYDGLFRFLGEAKAAMDVDDRARTGERLDRAYAILEELAGALQPSAAPDLCDSLQAIYLFCMGRVVEANLARSPAVVDEVMRVLTPLREGFRTAVAEADKAEAQRSMAAAGGMRGGR